MPTKEISQLQLFCPYRGASAKYPSPQNCIVCALFIVMFCILTMCNLQADREARARRSNYMIFEEDYGYWLLCAVDIYRVFLDFFWVLKDAKKVINYGMLPHFPFFEYSWLWRTTCCNSLSSHQAAVLLTWISTLKRSLCSWFCSVVHLFLQVLNDKLM